MSIFSFIKSHAVLAGTVGAVAVAAAIIGGRVASRSQTSSTAGSNLKHVSLVRASDFRTDSSSVSADGVVQALSQADVKAQVSAPIVRLAAALGDQVKAGEIIAELSNADLRAQLDQAKLSLSAEGISLEAARKAAVDSVRESYLKADEAVHAQVDPMLFNSTKTSPQLSAFVTSPITYQDIWTMRADLTNSLSSWKGIVEALADGASDSEIVASLKASEKAVVPVRALLDKISLTLNEAAIIAVPADLGTVNAWKATITAARSSMSGVASALTAADKALSSALVTQGGEGTSPSTVAEAAVRNLEAQLAKTVVRAPITGKVSALPLRSGELATAGSLIASIVGPGTLQIDAFASAEDIAKIARGAKAYIQGTSTVGRVESISPSVNPANRKVEVKILLLDPEATGLVIGQNVNVRIEAIRTAQGDTGSSGTYRMPIQNVKIVPGNAFVFTLDESSKLVRHDITLGDVRGDFIEVKSGLTPDMQIVTPVYELEEGQEVIAN